MSSNLPDAGELREHIWILNLAEDENGDWGWEAVRKSWAKITPGEKSNLFSSVGIGARDLSLVLRRQDLNLHQAILWGTQHIFLTSIIPLGQSHYTVHGAAVDIATCREVKDGAASFPAVLTEKYLRFQQSEPMALNILTYVLVTPKRCTLTPGGLVDVDGTVYAIQVAHELDAYKNEYEIVKKKDL